ncbi:MAG: hypothetical protein IPP73_03145 [Chitinophagaceae bacterium]|nr:hypothetical protein [Chitinophagaceae bacterium]
MNKKSLHFLLPVACILLFIALYIIATFHYPGGSQADIHSPGFSWKNNYWCNLLNEKAINGETNNARPYALVGMSILCVGLILFWWMFSAAVVKNKWWKKLIPATGTLAMTGAFFSFTSLHDLVINLASACGLIALTGTLAGLYKQQWHLLFRWGLLNIFLVLLNNLFYYTPSLISYLPVIQKISFGVFLLWFSMISIRLLNTLPRRDQQLSGRKS